MVRCLGIFRLFVVVPLLCAVLTGCWNRRELNELAIVVGLGIDKTGDRYKATVQIVNPGTVTANEKDGSQAPVVTFDSTGATLPDALRRMSVLSPRRLYFSHLRMVVFGEALAKEGLRKPLDFLSRDPEMRNDFYLVTARGTTASRILKTYSPMDPIPANNLYTKLELSDRLWAGTGKITLNDLVVDMSTKGKSALLTGVVLMGKKQAGENNANARHISPESNLVYAGSAVFQGDRLIGWIGEEATKAVNYVDNTVDKTLGYVDCPKGGRVSMNVIDSKSAIRVFMRGDKPEVNVHIRVEQDIAGAECDIDLTRTSEIDRINREGAGKIKKLIDDAVVYAQDKMGADIFGFGTYVHRQCPEYWRGVKDWNEEFRRLEVRVHVATATRRIGTIQQPIYGRTERRG